VTFHFEPNPRELEQYHFAIKDLDHMTRSMEWLWPDEDESLAGDLPTLCDVDTEVLPYIPEDRRRVVLQAGGAIGAWPKRFSQLFDLVYTAEPYPPSFHCLTVNAPELNIIKMNVALGNEHRMVKMDFPEHRERSATGKENIGGFRVVGSGDIPMLKIDDFNFPMLDLIYLDLEGYELMALRGAERTIRECKPWIVLEDKASCSRRYGYEPGEIEQYLKQEFGYRTVKRFHGQRDVLIAPPNE